MTKKAKPKPVPRDIALLHGPTEDGQGARLLRFREGSVQAGELRPVREGQPLGAGELVRLKPLHHQLPVCEVEVLHAPAKQAPEDAPDPAQTRSGTGPARVSTRRYRRNWNAVFGAKPGGPLAGPHGDEPDYSVN